MKPLKPLLFLVDDRIGFWTRGSVSTHWDRLSDTFEIKYFPLAKPTVASEIRAVIVVSRATRPEREAYLITDARMHERDESGLELAMELVIRTKTISRAVVYSSLAVLSQAAKSCRRIHAERNIDEPSTVMRLRRYLQTGKINRVSEIVAYWNSIFHPWRSALECCVTQPDARVRAHFRPMAAYGRPVGDPVMAEYWLDPFAVKWPDSFMAPYSPQMYSVFSDDAAEEWMVPFGGAESADAVVAYKQLWAAFHPDDSLLHASRGVRFDDPQGNLRLLWEAVQSGGDASNMPVERPQDEKDLVPREVRWVIQKRSAAKRQLEALGNLRADYCEGRARLVHAALRELLKLERYFEFLQRREADRERAVL
jgi:hypothetical protein